MATVQYKTPREDAKDTERTQVGGKPGLTRKLTKTPRASEGNHARTNAQSPQTTTGSPVCTHFISHRVFFISGTCEPKQVNKRAAAADVLLTRSRRKQELVTEFIGGLTGERSMQEGEQISRVCRSSYAD